MRALPSKRVASWAFVLILSLGAVMFAQAPKPYGAASPEDAIAALKKAIAENDFPAAVRLFAPDSLTDIARKFVTLALKVVALSDGQDKRVLDLARQMLTPHGMDRTVGKPPDDPETQKALDTALARGDTIGLTTTAIELIDKTFELRGMKPPARPPSPMNVGDVTDFQTTGEQATAQHGHERIQFVRVEGRWYIWCPTKSPQPQSP